MIVLVCGGRDYADWPKVLDTLDLFHHRNKMSILVHGGAAGADSLADRWAQLNGIQREEVKAKWTQLGKAAGPIRNAAMLHIYVPQWVIAFPGGAGTASMVSLAKRAGIKIAVIA